jgi:hypothetical protein
VSITTVDEHLEHANPRIMRAREKLQEAFRELAEAFDAYSVKFKGTPSFDEQSMRAILIPTPSQTVVSGDAVGKAIEALVMRQTAQPAGLASKIGSYVGRLYPLASLTLGLISPAAEVG